MYFVGRHNVYLIFMRAINTKSELHFHKVACVLYTYVTMDLNECPQVISTYLCSYYATDTLYCFDTILKATMSKHIVYAT